MDYTDKKVNKNVNTTNNNTNLLPTSQKQSQFNAFLRRKQNRYPYDPTPRNNYGGAIGRDC